MDGMKSIAMSVCLVSAGICTIRSLLSGSVLRERAEVLLKMVFIVVLINPFVRGTFSFELPELTDYELSEYSYSREESERELIQQASENISQVLLEQITAAGIVCENISAEVNISDDGSIIISKVTIMTDDFEKAEKIVGRCLGSEMEVLNGYSG